MTSTLPHRASIAKTEPAPPVRLMRADGRDAFTYATVAGIFEPAADVGDSVRAGQYAGSIHPIEGPDEPQTQLHFIQSGLAAGSRAPALTASGDCLFKVVTDVEWRSDKGCEDKADNPKHRRLMATFLRPSSRSLLQP